MSDPAKLHSSVVGGSSAERVLNCPGSMRLTAEAVARSSVYAEEGTALHLAMEHLLRHNLLPYDLINMTFHDHVITVEHATECITPALAAFEKVVGDKPFELEVKAPLLGVEGAFGTSDVVYFTEAGVLLGILDWKFGAGHKVEAAGNAQMMFYLYSQMMRRDVKKSAPMLAATIVQPRLEHVDTTRFSRSELNKFVWALSAAITGPETFVKGAWCHWCLGKPRCPEWWGKRVARLQRFTAGLPGVKAVRPD